jgi:predicted nuclease with TOPRIM domain
MASSAKTEPKLEALPETPVEAVVAPIKLEPKAPVEAAPDQLARIEDKTARIEEKFARSEERMMRLESALEKATLRLEGATQDMNLQGVKDDIVSMRERLGKKPGAAVIFVIALVAALIGAGVSFALTKFGIPGLVR